MKIRALLTFILILVIFISNAFANPIPQRKIDPDFKPMYGIAYSFEQAGWYGLDPRGEYVRMLDEFKFDWVRLPFFWDQMVNEKGELRIENLKFALEEADKRQVKVIIALGAKTPYSPEYHWPDDVASKEKFGETVTADHPAAKDILSIDQKVVEELAVFDNIIYWQVENEPL